MLDSGAVLRVGSEVSPSSSELEDARRGVAALRPSFDADEDLIQPAEALYGGLGGCKNVFGVFTESFLDGCSQASRGCFSR